MPVCIHVYLYQDLSGFLRRVFWFKSCSNLPFTHDKGRTVEKLFNFTMKTCWCATILTFIWIYGWNSEVSPFKSKLLNFVSLEQLCLRVCIWNPIVWPFKSLSNESYWAVLSCGAVYHAVQGGSNVWVRDWLPKVRPFTQKLLSSTFLWCGLSCCTRWL